MRDTAAPPSAQPEPRIGSYRLIQQLGSGGMGSVFQAVHPETGLVVAVKILPRYLAKNPTLLQRFLREARSAEALEHPSIVAIYDRGADQGRHYLVLEYVAGGDLHDRVKNFGPLGAAEAVAIIKAVAQGLEYAASRGVIHRDVKPANLLVTPEGAVKITDLGLALQVEDEDERVTRDGTTVGTVDYMAPEQARDSRATGVRSDIYSLGCTSYFLLTGNPPFSGGDLTAKLRRHATEPAPDVRQVRPEVSPALSRIIRRMMEKDPRARFPDHRHLIEALDELPTNALDPDGDPQLVPLDESAEFHERPRSGAQAAAAPARSSPVVASSPDRAEAATPATRPKPGVPLLRQILDEESQAPAQHPTAFTKRRPEASTRDYIVRGALVGMLLATVGVGLRQLIFFIAAHVGTLSAPPIPAPIHKVADDRKAEPPKGPMTEDAAPSEEAQNSEGN